MPRGNGTVGENCRWALYCIILIGIIIGFHYQAGTAADRRLHRIEKLIAAGKEQSLYPYLRADDPVTVQYATHGLWECWLNEKGPTARENLERGVAAMYAGNFTVADRTFSELTHQYPDWAEALNKQATLLYLEHQPAASLAMCERVVKMKPNHFGAWSGMAMCAIKLEDWPLARYACQQALRIQPHTVEHRRMLSIIELHIPSLDV